MNSKDSADVTERQNSKLRRPSRKPPKNSANSNIIIGKNVNAGLTSWKGADLTVARYIGRVAVGVSSEMIQTSLKSGGIDVVSLDQVKTKHERFSSFKLVVKKAQLPLIENPELWPEGVIVGRWWNPKPPTVNSNLTSAKDG